MRVLPTKLRRKPAGIDMERNYVTVTPIDTADPRALYYNDFVRYFGVVRCILLQAASAVRVFAGGVCCARVKNRQTAARIVGP